MWQAIDTSCERRGRRAESNEESGESRVQEAPKLQRRSNARGGDEGRVEVEKRCANTKASVYAVSAVRPRSGAQRLAEH